MSFGNEILVAIASAILGWVQSNAATLEAELQPFVTAGEASLVAAATKVNPFLGYIVTEAVTYLGADLPKYEGNAVAWVESTIAAFIKRLGG